MRELSERERAFVAKCLDAAEKHDRQARELRATVDRIYEPGEGTRVEIARDYCRFVTSVPATSASMSP